MRPTIYNKEIADKICSRIAGGESLKRVCEDPEMPCRSIVHLWLLDEEKKEFMDNYKKAVDIRTDNMFDELEEISDTDDRKESPMRSRLRVDTRKWYLSKVMPKKYGDKMDVTSDGKPIPLIPLKNGTLSNNNSNEEDSETK